VVIEVIIEVMIEIEPFPDPILSQRQRNHCLLLVLVVQVQCSAARWDRTKMFDHGRGFLST